MAIQGLGVLTVGGFAPGAISRYYWIRPELTQVGLKILGKGSLVGLSMQVTALAAAIIALFITDNQNNEDKRFYGAYTIVMIATVPTAVALAGWFNFRLSYEEAATTAALSYASGMGLMQLLN